MPDLESLRILEISAVGLVKRTLPAQTRFFSTGRWKAVERAGPGSNDFASLAELIRYLRAGEFDAIVCLPSMHSPWHWQTISRLLFNRHVLADMRRPLRHFGPQILRFHRLRPIIVGDFEDTSYIDRDNFFLMDLAQLYFKRELPADEWRLFTKTASDTQPSMRLRRNRRFGERLAKVRPISLGLPHGAEEDLPREPVAKETDIFFAGTVQGMPVRERALRELVQLKDEGFVVDIPEQPVSRPEFYRRCARAWLTLSPEGLGWDCFRHYEAAACGSVPLTNTPSILRHKPLLDGEHTLFYGVEPGFLAARAREALGNKKRLAAIAEAGRAHVLAHHTKRAVVRHMLEAGLAHVASEAAPAGQAGV